MAEIKREISKKKGSKNKPPKSRPKSKGTVPHSARIEKKIEAIKRKRKPKSANKKVIRKTSITKKSIESIHLESSKSNRMKT